MTSKYTVTQAIRAIEKLETLRIDGWNFANEIKKSHKFISAEWAPSFLSYLGRKPNKDIDMDSYEDCYSTYIFSEADKLYASVSVYEGDLLTGNREELRAKFKFEISEITDCIAEAINSRIYLLAVGMEADEERKRRARIVAKFEKKLMEDIMSAE